MKYDVYGHSDMQLTKSGKAGAALFVGGAVASAAFSWFYYDTLIKNAAARSSYGLTDPAAFGALAGLGALAFLVGFVLLLTGRRMSHVLRAHPSAAR